MPLTDKEVADLKRLIKDEVDNHPIWADYSRRGG